MKTNQIMRYLTGIELQTIGWNGLMKNKYDRITACKQYCLAAGATQGNIAYTQTVSCDFMTTQTEYIYEVGFSFLKQDEAIAYDLNDHIQDRLTRRHLQRNLWIFGANDNLFGQVENS